MDRKGQALVEFVLILPLFIFLVMIIYDFGMIYTKKSSLENRSSDIIELYRSGETIDEIRHVYQEVEISFSDDDKYDKLVISVDYNTITPGMDRIFGNPYKLEVVRYIPNED